MQQTLPLQHAPYRNSGLFSSHWLENRLPIEPEWTEFRTQAGEAAAALSELWATQKSRVERYGNEQALEHAFIQPVLGILGWKLNYQTFLQSRIPDYGLFLTDDALDAALAAGRKSHEFWDHVTVVADAKAWTIPLDRPTTARGQREYPPQQIEWYLDRSRRDFGILTNGRLWRLVPREREPHQDRFETWYEFDLPEFLNRYTTRLQDVDDFLYFYLLFGPPAFTEVAGRRPLIQRAVEGSSAYRLGIGEDLRQRAFEAVRLVTEGYFQFPGNNLQSESDLDLCRRESFVLIYRLLFIMFAEDRGLLPYTTNHLYRENRSLRRHRDEIARRLDAFRNHRLNDFSRNTCGILDDLRLLFDLVDSGHGRYGVPPYNGGLFDPEEHAFLENMQISDWHLARAIDYLGRARDPDLRGDDLFRVDYRDLAIQHLGNIYEGLLELTPHRASVPMIVVARHSRDRTEERTVPKSHPIPDGFEPAGVEYEVGQIFLHTNKGERRASGSYYTPDHIVNHIVEQTLRPICEKISDELGAELAPLIDSDGIPRLEQAERAARLQSGFDDRVLQLRVLDPAMGSGHFLLRACAYLAEEIATHPCTGDETVDQLGSDESAIVFWKRRVAENCLYGVDLNDLAVELAKLAMWLETVAIDQPLTYLNHHFRHGNSLIGARIAAMRALPDAEVMDVGLFEDTFREKIPALIGPMAQILETPSQDLKQVKAKQQLFKKLEKARRPFRQLADVWCSTFCLPESERPFHEDYRALVQRLDQPRRFAAAIDGERFQRSLQAVRADHLRPFHWELEFPEVYFDADGRRGRPGFDAVIGNPPYDVLSERETGHDLAALRAVIGFDSVYAPSVRGKNNLYKLFVCRALELLADGGYLGFITPMAVLGDDQAAGLRKALLQAGAFTTIDAFPQKDNPQRRIFPEAKLSTAVFVLHKTVEEPSRRVPFVLRVHPGRDLEEVQATLRMSSDQIPLYDPSNQTIISCDQEDFDLATRMMASGRCRRLKDVAEFFQGEVNETVQTRRGTVSRNESIKFHRFVTRGASICLYVLREPSQGNDLYLDVNAFLEGAAETSKAFHHRYERVAVQESSPQNNFRRIIAAKVPAGEFCNHTINYVPGHTCMADLRLLLAVLDSKIAEWYFRLGSTNAHVSHYQLYNLPFPRFSESSSLPARTSADVLDRLDAPDVDAALDLLRPWTERAPFDAGLISVICQAVDRIIRIESERGEIARSARSALAAPAQPYQQFLDRLFYRLAGLTDEEAARLEQRLAAML